MKNWKRLFATALSATMVAGLLTACGGDTASGSASAGSASGSAAQGSDFPAGKSINMIIHASAGGLSDTNARFISQMVQEELGVPVVAQNKVGGSGVVAMTYVKNSAPDGYTIGYLP